MVSKKHALGATTACLATVALALGAGVAQAGTGAPPFNICPGDPQYAGITTAVVNGAPISIDPSIKCF